MSLDKKVFEIVKDGWLDLGVRTGDWNLTRFLTFFCSRLRRGLNLSFQGLRKKSKTVSGFAINGGHLFINRGFHNKPDRIADARGACQGHVIFMLDRSYVALSMTISTTLANRA